MPLDDLVVQTSIDPTHGPARLGIAVDHIAVLTLDITAEGIVPVARNHAQLIGGGLAPFLEADLAQDAVLLSTVPPASIVGPALTKH
jgi:hypothetical protein